jgi:peptidoglycan/xylan/chitin deacetylase (PgdA/CDA1 family)
MDLDGGDFQRQMHWLASTERVRRLEDVLANLDTPDDEYVITFDDGYEDMYDNGFPLLRELGLPFTLYLTTAPIETRRPLRDDGRSIPVTWDHVGEMVASGLVTMGAHTHTHPDLRHVSEEEIEHEIGASNELILERTGESADHFTYPWGYWTQAADRVMRRHYSSATVAGCDTTRFASPYSIPRLPVQLADGWTFFRPRLRGGFRIEDKIRRLVSGYEGP